MTENDQSRGDDTDQCPTVLVQVDGEWRPAALLKWQRVINGLPESRARYLMHGSVSSVSVWGDDSSRSVQSSLERLPAEQMQTAQNAGSDVGHTASIHIRIDAVASGETVLSNDPNDCSRDASGQMEPLEDGETPQQVDGEGCLRAPAPYAGLAEVVIYVAP